MTKAVRLSKEDDIATLLGNLSKGDSVDVISVENEIINDIVALQNIPYGNKIALRFISSGDQIIKNNLSIGKAIKDIELGQFVHVHNVRSENLDIPNNIIEIIIKEMGIEQ